MRLALLGAFAFPAPQGSQVYARDQALALRSAGAEVCVVCYGERAGEPPPGLEVVRIGAALSPAGFRSGPRLGKPLADLALARRLVRLQRERRFDAVLAHNAEAAIVALAARAVGGPPVVYVAHTLGEEELSAYAPASLRRPCDRIGRRLDRLIARRADATIALSRHATGRLGAEARGPVALIPPGCALRDPPADAEIDAACARRGLRRDGFALYAGNFDAYQEPEALIEIAARCAPHPLVAVTHSPPDRELAPLRVVEASPQELQPLLHGAAVALATRSRRGGFPIKLLNYMQAGRAIVVRAGQMDDWVHGVDAWLVPERAAPEAFAKAFDALLGDPEQRARLGAAARERVRTAHAWPELAARTLALIAALRKEPRS
jgi:glycosyltransferase involved in cell wall biosynthesis